MPLPLPSPGSAALVTGASSGIGAELARELARRGHHVVVTARRRERLDDLAGQIAEAGGRAEVVACDLADAASREELAAAVERRGLGISVLCNNAGFGTSGAVVDVDREEQLGVLRVNSEAMIDLCARFAPAMARQREGAILNVCSLMSLAPVPRQATYSASKAAALTFTQALRLELRPFGIPVTALCPGAVRTEFPDRSGVGHLARKAPRVIFDEPADVARFALKALERGRGMAIPNPAYRLAGRLLRLAPQSAVLELMDRAWPVGR